MRVMNLMVYIIALGYPGFGILEGLTSSFPRGLCAQQSSGRTANSPVDGKDAPLGQEDKMSHIDQ